MLFLPEQPGLRRFIVIGVSAFLAMGLLIYLQRHLSKSDSSISFITSVVAVATLCLVVVQVVLALEQVEIANKQTDILRRQDQLLYGTASGTVFSPEAAGFGSDELQAEEMLTILVRNTGQRMINNCEITIAVPETHDFNSESWLRGFSVLPGIGYATYRRKLIQSLPPQSQVSIDPMVLRRVKFERSELPLLWRLDFDGGGSPPGYAFSRLSAT